MTSRLHCCCCLLFRSHLVSGRSISLTNLRKSAHLCQDSVAHANDRQFFIKLLGTIKLTIENHVWEWTQKLLKSMWVVIRTVVLPSVVQGLQHAEVWQFLGPGCLKTLVPESLHNRMEHWGVACTLILLKERCVCARMYEDVESWVQNYESCLFT